MAENNTVFNDDNNPALIAVAPDGTARNVKSDNDGNLKVTGDDLGNAAWTRRVGVFNLVSSAQTLTASFADLGNEIDASGYKYVTLYLTIDINSSNDVRIKVLGKHTVAGSEEYVFDPDLLNAADTTASTSYIEFDTDADQLATVRIPVDNALPVLQIQASVGMVGATGADIDAAYYTLGY